MDEAVLNRAVERILNVLFSYADHRHPEAIFDRNVDHEKAVQVETECAVLLENNGVLPIGEGKKIAYIGEFAEKPRYQGGGSSHINASKVSSALDSAHTKGRSVTYVKGFPADKDKSDATELAKAVEAAQNADVAVIFAGLPDIFESEGYDRTTMAIPNCQNQLIEEVLKVQPNTVVVLHNGSPIEAPWADRAAAVLELYLGGQGVGEACDRLLYGEVNPSGRLAETFPFKLEDNPSYLYFPGDGKTANYAEGVFVGYRYYDTKKMPVRWAFGHGLSYTEFAYSNLRLSQNKLNDHGKLVVQVDVTNIGKIAGKEVVQLYVSDRNNTPERPVKELKGFAKVHLTPGETKTISLELTARDLSFYHEGLGDWYAPTGSYDILVGHASDDIRLTKTISFETEKVLPFRVDGATTVGDLLKHPKTADAMGQMLAAMGGGNVSNEGNDAALMEATLDGMPLKSLMSFGVPGEQIEAVISQLDTLCK